MNRAGWLGAAVVFAAVDVGYIFLLSSSSPRGADEDIRSYVLGAAVLAGPAALAGALLWGAWWLHIGVRLVAFDAPARLLAAAVAVLPADRRDWGAAMTAELAQVPGRRQRWRFAIGCARTAVLPPRGRWAPVLAVAALATAVVVGTTLAVGRALPELRVFAVTFVGLVATLATVAASRARRLRRPAAGLPITLTVLAGVVACVAVTGYYLRTDASVVLAPHAARTLAVWLAVGLWLAFLPPPALTTSRRARRTGLGVGLAVTGGLFLNRLSDISAGHSIGLYLLAIPVVAMFHASFFVALIDRSLRAGLQAAVWAVVATCPPSFAGYVIEASRYQQAGIHPIDGDPISGPLGLQLHEAVGWILAYIPLSALPFGILGAALGAAGAAGRTPPRPRHPTPDRTAAAP